MNRSIKNLWRTIPSHIIVSLSAWICRVITAVSQIMVIRILIKNYGPENYAVFALITSLTGWYNLIDMGLGISVQNYISEHRAKGESYKTYIVTTGIISFSITIIFALIIYILTPFISKELFFTFNNLSLYRSEMIFLFSGLLYILTGIGGIGYRVWYAEQKGYLSNIFPGLGSLIGLLGVWLLFEINFFVDKVFWSIIIFILPNTVMAILSFTTILISSQKDLKNYISRKILFELMNRGLKFWFFGIMGAFVLQIDYLVISQTLQVVEISKYSVLSKIFLFVFFIYYSILLALWPVCSEKIIKNEWVEVGNLLKRYIKIGVIFVVFSTTSILFTLPLILKILAPEFINGFSIITIILFGIYYIVRVWTDTFTMILQSMNDLKIFWVWVPIHALINFILQWFFAHKFGLNGILVGLILSFLLTVAWVLPKRFNKNYKIYNLKEKN